MKTPCLPQGLLLPQKFWGVLALILLTAAAPAPANDWLYIVESGENLWDLAARYLIDVSYTPRLQTLNRIADPYHIPPGTRLRMPLQWLKSSAFAAGVVDVRGETTLIEDDTGQTVPLHPGSIVAAGDVLETGANANLTLKFVDGSRLLLLENSRLRLNRVGVFGDTGMADNRLLLEKGRAETQVAPREPATRFEISTPSAITSVRGTDYRVSLADTAEASRAEVLRGKVDVRGAGRSRVLSPGQGTVVMADRAPEPPVPLPPAPDLSQLPATLDRVPIQFALPNAAAGSLHRIQLSAKADFTTLVMDKTVAGNVVKGSDLPDGNYHLRARAVDARGLEGLNAEREIEINARPEPPFLLEPKPGAGVAEEQPAFVWSKPVGIGKFRFQVAEQADFRRVLLDVAAHPESRLVASAKLPLGRYYWRVAAIDDREGSGPFSDPQEFRRVVPAPALEEPEVSGESLLIRCRAGLPGQRYQFQLATDQDFENILVDRQEQAPKLELAVPDSGTYYLRVRTIDPDGFENPYGPPQELEIPANWYWWLALLPLFALFAL